MTLIEQETQYFQSIAYKIYNIADYTRAAYNSALNTPHRQLVHRRAKTSPHAHCPDPDKASGLSVRMAGRDLTLSPCADVDCFN